MGWTPSLRARALSSSRAYAIGLVFEMSPEALASDQYYTSLMAGLQSVLSTSEYSLVTEVVDSHRGGAQRLPATGPRRPGRRHGHRRPAPGRPAVRDGPGRRAGVREPRLAAASATTMPVLVYDEQQAIADVVAHLVELGHRRIAQVVGPQTGAPARLRRELYQKRLRDHGLDDARWIESDYTARGGRAATEPLLGRRRPAHGDRLLQRPDGGRRHGHRVRRRACASPRTSPIVGWDDITVSQYLHPALSTVTQHPFDDGRVAATLLLEAIEGREFDEPVWMPDPGFVPRESSGAAPA